MRYRTRSPQLQEFSKSTRNRILVLTGARQTGKTTLLRKLLGDYSYLSIEDPVLRMQYAGLSATQWQSLYPKAILDEIQKQASLIESIKATYDQYDQVKYALSGSSQLLLLQQVKESLAGRCQLIELYPLTLPEMLSADENTPAAPSYFQQLLRSQSLPNTYPSLFLDPKHAEKKRAYDHYLEFGGYPALYADEISIQEKQDWLKNYIRTYLERDIRDLAEFRNLEPFVRIQQMTAILTGQQCQYAQLGREAGVQASTAQRFLQYLELSYQVLLLPPWSRNALKRLVKSPKIHYLDPGIQRAITGKIQGLLSGHEYESAIVAELYKQAKNIDFNGRFYHLRTSDGREIDLLIETAEGYWAFEIKQSQHISYTDTRHLRDLETLLDKPLLHSFILSEDSQVRSIAAKITALPAALFLC